MIIFVFNLVRFNDEIQTCDEGDNVALVETFIAIYIHQLDRFRGIDIFEAINFVKYLLFDPYPYKIVLHIFPRCKRVSIV